MAPKEAKSIEEEDKSFNWTKMNLSLLLKVIMITKPTKLQTEKIGKLLKGNMKTSLKGFSKDILRRFPMPHK